MSRSAEHARFCPYCGKQLREQSKFCPQCGKVPPRRRRASAALERAAITPRTDSANRPKTAATDRPTGSAIAAERPFVASPGGSPRPISPDRARASRSLNNAAGRAGVARPAALRYAPPTHSRVGAFEQAGFGLRYGAWMFDFLITLIAMMGFTFILTAASKRSVVGSNTDLLIVLALTTLLFVLNFVVFAGINGQSAGMRILGIRIMRLDGRPFTRKDALVRHLLGYPLSMVAFFLGFLWMLWDPRQQGWHDKLARTLVVMSR